MTHEPEEGSRSKTWLAAILATGGVLVIVGIVVFGAIGFAVGAAIGAALTETGRECRFEECVDSGILPGAAIGFVVGALAGGLAAAVLWARGVRKPRPDRAEEGPSEPRP